MPDHDSFCGQCGTPRAVNLGTDAASRSFADEILEGGAPVAPREPTAPDGHGTSPTAVLPVLGPDAPSAGSPVGTRPTPPTVGHPGGDGPASGARLALVAVAVAVLFLAGLAVALSQLLGGGSDTPTVAAPRTTSVTSGATTAGGPTTAPPATTPPTATTPPPAKVKVPTRAKTCSTKGTSAYAMAVAGNDVTSCPFASAVRDAYAAAKGDGEAVELRVTSPVTHKPYTMTCQRTAPVLCTGGSSAVVYLTPSGR